MIGRALGATRGSVFCAIAFGALAASHVVAQVCCSTMPVEIECDGTGQACGRSAFVYDEYTRGELQVEIRAASNHCSDVQFEILLNGAPAYLTPFLGAGASSGMIDLGPVAEGYYTIEVRANGREGGCNHGYIEGWAADLTVCSNGGVFGSAFSTNPDVCAGESTLFVASAAGHTPIFYQWYKDGAPLTETPDRFVGVFEPLLSVQNIELADAGVYTCVLSNHCQIQPVTAGTLNVQDCSFCPADFNQDGGIDGADVDAFFGAWENGDGSADVNQDGGVDGADVDTFFIAWEAGGCG